MKTCKFLLILIALGLAACGEDPAKTNTSDSGMGDGDESRVAAGNHDDAMTAAPYGSAPFGAGPARVSSPAA